MKKILSLLLVMAMLLSVAPMTWAAEQAESEATAPVQYRSLVLSDSIAINFKISRAWLADNGFTKAEFLMDGKVAQTIEGMPAGTSELAVFPFTQLTPAQMGKDVTVKYYAGEEVLTEATTSVLSYCNDTLNDANESALLKTALVDMLNYGAAAQTYVGLADGETLVNADLGANAALGTPANKELTLTNRTHLHDFPNTQQSRSDEVQWLSAGLNLQDAVALRFKIEIAVTDNIDSVDDLSVKFYSNDFVRIVEEFVPVAGKDNQYYVYLDGLNPAQLRDPIFASIYDKTTVVCNRLTYSVESYAADNASDPEALKAMTKALMVYGDAITAWVKDAGIINLGSDLTYIEAEDTQLATGIDGTFEHNKNTMVLINDGTAVEWGAYGSMVDYTAPGSTDLTTYPAHLSFDVKPATSGTYYIWGLVSQKGGSNVYGYIDGQQDGKSAGWAYYTFNANSADSSDYKWVRLSVCKWDAGQTYGIRFRGRNSNWTAFDRFMITSSSVGGHDHVVDANWSKDATNHWHGCTFAGCTYAVDKAAHSYGADNKCVCGKQIYIANSDMTFIEAENVDLVEYDSKIHATNKVVSTVEDASAKNGAYITLGYSNLNFADPATRADGSSDLSVYPAHVSFDVKASTTAKYYIWALVKNTNTSVSASQVKYIDGVQTAWAWANLAPQTQGTYKWVIVAECNWTAGNTYTVRLRARQQQIAIDQFMVTSENVTEPHEHTYSTDWTIDANYHWNAATCGCTDRVANKAAHSYGADGKCVCGKVSFYTAGSDKTVIEAEDVILSTKVTVGANTGALNGSAAKLPAGAADANTTGKTEADGYLSDISFEVKPNEAGTYFIWARISSGSGSTIWSDIDGLIADAEYGTYGAGWQYDKFVTADHYTANDTEFIWVRIATCDWTDANAMYTVRLRARQGTTIIFDRFVVTSDKSYAPILGDSIATFDTDTVIEAEDTSLDMSRVNIETTDSGKVVFMDKYIQDDTYSNFQIKDGVAGAIRFNVNADQPGTYYVYVKMTQASSVYVSFNGGDYTGKCWPQAGKWVRLASTFADVSYTTTEPGESIEISLVARQSNNRIDQFYVTTDANWKGPTT